MAIEEIEISLSKCTNDVIFSDFGELFYFTETCSEQ